MVSCKVHGLQDKLEVLQKKLIIKLSFETP